VRPVVALLLCVVVGLSSEGCDASVSSGDGKTTGGCEAASYDLSRPPSRADFAMQPGKSYVDRSCDAGFPVTFTLPEGAEISLTARAVTADSYDAANSETGDPTTVDVHSVGLRTDEAVQLATRLAVAMGIDAGPMQDWRRQVESDTTQSDIDSLFMRNRLGYLTADMQVQHLGVAPATNYLHLIFTWG
jgi:hypothetical protein